MADIKPRAYKKTMDYSYADGAFSCYELLKTHPEEVIRVYIHPDFSGGIELSALCKEKKVEAIRDAKAFKLTGQKDNSMAFAMFSKYQNSLVCEMPHVALVNPMDMGNLGTVVRTMAGFGLTELAVVSPAADIFNPKTVRASMGALFRINFKMFGSFEEYRIMFPVHKIFPFMTDGEVILNETALRNHNINGFPYTLVFGNEAQGLNDDFHNMGVSIKIPQSGMVDSLNLSVSAAIGMYYFTSLIRPDRRS